MKFDAKATNVKQNLLSSFDGAKNLLAEKFSAARSSALTRAVGAGERLVERQNALLGKLKERAAQ